MQNYQTIFLNGAIRQAILYRLSLTACLLLNSVLLFAAPFPVDPETPGLPLIDLGTYGTREGMNNAIGKVTAIKNVDDKITGLCSAGSVQLFKHSKWDILRYTCDKKRYEAYFLYGGCSGFASSTGFCTGLDSQDPSPIGSECKGNPINISTGAKIQVEKDFAFTHGSLLNFTRIYSSDSKKWVFPFTQMIEETDIDYAYLELVTKEDILDNEGNVIGEKDVITPVQFSPDKYVQINRPDGSHHLFALNTIEGNHHYTGTPSNGAYVEKTLTGWVYVKGKTTETYNNTGLLVGIQTPDDFLSITYNTGSIDYSDSYGNTLTKTPTTDGFTVSDGSNTTTYEFTAGLLTTVTFPDNNTVTYGYDTTYTGALTSITDEDDKVYATWEYALLNGKVNAIASSHANDAERVELVYSNDSTDVYTSTDFKGSRFKTKAKKATYYFDDDKRITEIVGEALHTCLASNTTYTYNNGYQHTETDSQGNVTETQRNANGWVTIRRTGLEWDSDVLVTTTTTQEIKTTWAVDLQLPVERVFSGYSTGSVLAYKKETWTYDVNNRVTQHLITDLTSTATPQPTQEKNYVYTYYQDINNEDDVTRLKTVTSDNPFKEYTYNAQGFLAQTKNAKQQIITYENHTASGQPSIITDANAIRTFITYNNRGWITEIKTLKQKTLFSYNGRGLVTKVTRPDGAFLAYTYDDARRLIAVQNNLHERLEITPSQIHSQWKEMRKGQGDSSGTALNSATTEQTIGRFFDGLGRLLVTFGTNGNQVVEYGYDANDNLVNTFLFDEDSDFSSTTLNEYSYDAQNRKITMTDALDNDVTVDYDDQGNIISITDQRGLETTYKYNGFGQLLSMNSPDTGLTTYRYKGDQLTSKKDNSGQAINYVYNPIGLVNEIRYLNKRPENVYFRYDQKSGDNRSQGYLTAVNDAVGNTKFRYGEQGLDATIFKLKENNRVFVTQFGIDETKGILTKLTYPSNNMIHYDYDAVGRINEINDTVRGNSMMTNIVDDVKYHPFSGMKTITFDSGFNINVSLDDIGRIDDIIAKNSAGDLFFHKTMAMNKPNNITAIDNKMSNTKRLFDYDALLRLTSDTQGSAVMSYVYDAVGNRTERKQTNDKGSTYTIDEDYTIDTISNQITDITKANALDVTNSYNDTGNIIESNGFTYTYNPAGRLNAVTSHGVAFTYNYLGQRSIKKTGGQSIYYQYDQAGRLIGEYDANTRAMIAEYIYINGLLIAFMDANKAIYYVVSDHLGTPQMLVDENDTIVWEATYDAFGFATLTTEDVTFNVRASNQYFDVETGLHYNWHRDYDPSIGRYIQSDPIGLAGGINTYGYAYQNPITNYDPDGRLVWFIPLLGGSTFTLTSGQLGMGLLTTFLFSDIFTGGDEWDGDIPDVDGYGGFTEADEADAIDVAENLQGDESCALINEMLNKLRNRLRGRERNIIEDMFGNCDKGHQDRIDRIKDAIDALVIASSTCI